MCEAGHCGEDIPAEDGHRGWQETVAGRIGCSLLFCPSALQTTTKSAVEGLVSRSIAQQTKARLYQEQRNMHLLIRSSKGSAALFQRCPSSVQVFCPLSSFAFFTAATSSMHAFIYTISFHLCFDPCSSLGLAFILLFFSQLELLPHLQTFKWRPETCFHPVRPKFCFTQPFFKN